MKKDNIITKKIYKGLMNDNLQPSGFEVNISKLNGLRQLEGETGRIFGNRYLVYHVNDCTLIYSYIPKGKKSIALIEATGRESKVSELKVIVNNLKRGFYL